MVHGFLSFTAKDYYQLRGPKPLCPPTGRQRVFWECPSMRKLVCRPDQLKSKPGPTRKARPKLQLCAALRLPRWRLPVMRLWFLNVYGAIMATLLFDKTILNMQNYQKLSTKVLSTLAGPALSRRSCIGPRASGGPAPWCLSRLFIFSRYRLRSITQ